MNTYLIKIALSAVPAPKDKSKEPTLRPHTRRALAKLERTGGLLVDHSMGSGKTLLYLKAIEAYQKKHPKEDTLFLAPASLTTNVDKEIKKHGVKIDVSKLNVMSYEKAAIAAEKLRKNKYGMVVADEAHKLRNTGTKRNQELSDIKYRADRSLLGTGTTAYNHVSDIAPLVNLAAGNPVLPEGKKAFEEKFVSKKTEQPPLLKRIMGSPAKEVHNLKGKRELSDVLRQYVDHYDLKDDPSAKDKFPTRTDKIIEVEMSPQQKALYGYMEDKLPFHLKLKVRMNMALDKRDTAQLQAFSSGIRQVSNSLKPFMPKHQDTTPKMIAAAESMHASYKADKKNFRGIAYSNYLGAGLQEYSDELKKRGVKHGLYHGGLSKTQKDQLVEDYNSGKVPVLVVSSSGTEGLNLKGTRKAQVLEPHFNKSKIDQFAARAIRFESHEHLPKAERTVEVEHFLSTLPKARFQFGPKQHSIDQYLHHNSETKNRLGEQMKELVKQAFETVDYTFPRAKYKESESFDHIKDPVGSLKRDGAAFFMEIGTDGSPKYYSRRESVKGGFPDRSEKLPHLSDNKLLDHIGNVYHVELYHTGHDASELAKDSHPAVSGILNSLPAKAIETQTRTGPVRAMLLDVISPKINTYGEKLEHMKQVANAFGKTEVLRAPDTKIGKAEIEQLIKDTKARADEGIIITSLTAPEDKNTRIKVKHVDTYNLRVVDINQEYDILGNPKESMGALVVVDRSGRIVCNVGTGFTREQRIEIWKNKENWIGKLIQVKAMPSAAHRLRAPVYNGLADGEIDNVSTWLK